MGRYVLLEPLGQGGMGIVYAAYDSKLDRRVALKLLHAERTSAPGSDGATSDRTRLLREAQAMAQLSHPNVVAVYDVGEVDRHIVMAMELVEGQTLRQWWRERKRDWREVLDVLAAAGRGLAAAHAAGLVHRDFKPSNVLVGRDGRVRVTDFGLARAHRTGEEPAPAPDAELLESSAKLLDFQVTRSGAMVGTPSYMAAELLAGQPADARSDQFAYCVALWEGLYGELPFAGETASERLQNVKEGRLRPPPAGARVPARLQRLLARGLQVDPAARFPSMDALLAEVDRRPEEAGKRLAAAAAGLLVLGVSGALSWSSWSNRTEALCGGAEERLDGVWDAGRQEAVEKAFLATGVAWAPDAFRRVQKVLGAYARDWTAMHREACEATRLRAVQTEAVMTARMACLDKRLQEVAALSDVFAEADAVVVGRAAQAAEALSGLRACADVEVLLAEVKPPADTATRERVDAVRVRLARAKALTDSGKQRESLDVTGVAIDEAKALGYPPVLAEALFAQGVGQVLSGDLTVAAGTLEQAVWTATAAHHDALAASAAVRLVGVYGVRGRREEAQLWDRHTSALVERLGGSDELEVSLLNNRGVGFLTRAELPQALDTFEQGLALARQRLKPTHPLVTRLETNRLAVLKHLGRFAEATRQMEESLRRAEETLGRHHPALAPLLLNAARVHTQQGRLREARQTLSRLLQMGEGSFTPGSANWAQYCSLAGRIYELEGRYDEALNHYEEALRLFELSMGPESPNALDAVLDVAAVHLRAGAQDEAEHLYERVLSVVEKEGGADHLDTLAPLLGLADIQERRGQHARALELRLRAFGTCVKGYDEAHPYCAATRAELASSEVEVRRDPRALSALEESVRRVGAATGTSSPLMVAMLQRQGEALLKLGHPAEALAPLKRATEVTVALRLDPNDVRALRALLARATVAAGEAPRAPRLTNADEGAFTRSVVPDVRRRDELRSWRHRYAVRLGTSPVAADVP